MMEAEGRGIKDAERRMHQGGAILGPLRDSTRQRHSLDPRREQGCSRSLTQACCGLKRLCEKQCEPAARERMTPFARAAPHRDCANAFGKLTFSAFRYIIRRRRGGDKRLA